MTSDKIDNITDNVIERMINKNMFVSSSEITAAWETINEQLMEELLDEQ